MTDRNRLAKAKAAGPLPNFLMHDCEECGTPHARLLCDAHHGNHRYPVRMTPEDFLA